MFRLHLIAMQLAPNMHFVMGGHWYRILSVDIDDGSVTVLALPEDINSASRAVQVDLTFRTPFTAYIPL